MSTSHSHIHATIQVMSDNGLRADEVEEIRVFVGDWHEVMCNPLDARRAPKSALDAKFSLPYLVAVAADRMEVGVMDFTQERREDMRTRDLAHRVVPVPDSNLDWKLEIPSGRVEIVLKDGRTFGKEGAHVPGTRQAPMTWDELSRKFDDCASASRLALSPEDLASFRAKAQTLEESEDAAELIRALS